MNAARSESARMNALVRPFDGDRRRQDGTCRPDTPDHLVPTTNSQEPALDLNSHRRSARTCMQVRSRQDEMDLPTSAPHRPQQFLSCTPPTRWADDPPCCSKTHICAGAWQSATRLSPQPILCKVTAKRCRIADKVSELNIYHTK